MNLADRLNRLRQGRRPDEPTEPPQAARDQDLLARLHRSAGRRRQVAAGQTRDSALRASEAALADGLLLTETVVRPACPDVRPALAGLPDSAAWSGDTDWLYLDTETTGLSGGVGTLVFMVGTARWLDVGSLQVRQYTLGRIGDESRLWQMLLDEFGPRTRLVTFNGKSFDLPLVEARCALCRMPFPEPRPAHLDLLYPLRRLFRTSWQDCRLQTAERRLLDLRREDDLPGELAPLAWQRWLRHGDARELEAVLRHNHQDVVSLALLHHRLIDLYRGTDPVADPADVGRAWLRAGQVEAGIGILEAAGEALGSRGKLLLAAEYKRRRDWSRAVDIWQGLHAVGCAEASSELARYFEHQRRDFRQAGVYAAHCRQAEREVRLARLRRRLGDGTAQQGASSM